MGTEFSGLNVIVTGAGSGIGLSVATKLTQAGAKVFGFDIAAGAMAGSATWIECDVGSSTSVREAMAKVASQVDVIDILINNAGVGAVGTILDTSDDEWARVLSINVTGISRVSTAVYPHLKASTSPAIVNTCSVAATVGLPKRAIYSASKGAVMSLTLAMAADFVKEGIRVNCVNPGTANTPWVARLLGAATDPEGERQALAARQPMGRLVTADEVASAILYLASPLQKSTTGTVLAVDGGMSGLRLPK
jgi:NAD(P)-dependent dehydrogenase (short-subunit alcohol dehydrogenase family)